MKTVVLHVLIDTKDKADVFRDIQISTTTKLETLHSEILKAFAFKGSEMAAFYEADADWDRGQEYPQIAMDPEQDAYAMSKATVGDLFSKKSDKGIYVYDFLRMWCFLIEVINTADESLKHAKVLLSVGEAPKEDSKAIGEGSFESDPNFEDDMEDEFSEDDFSTYDDDYQY